MAHNLARWTGRIALGEPVATTKTLRRRFFSLAGRLTRKARRLTLHLPRGLALGEPVQRRLGETARPATTLLIAQRRLPVRQTTQLPRRSASGRSPRVPCCNLPADLALRRRRGPPKSPRCGYHTLRPAGLERVKAAPPRFGSSHPWLPRGGQTLSVDLGLPGNEHHCILCSYTHIIICSYHQTLM